MTAARFSCRPLPTVSNIDEAVFFPSEDALEGSEISPAVMGAAVKDEMLFTCSGDG